MKKLCATSDSPHRDFMLLKLDTSNNFVVVQKVEINFKIIERRKIDEDSGAIRRAHQAEEDVCRHVGDDMDTFLFQKGWDKILNASKPWKHLQHLYAYLKKFRSRLTVPRTKLLWKDNASLRMITVHKRTTLTAGFGKAIKIIASEWMKKFAANLGIHFPLFRYVSSISKRFQTIPLTPIHSSPLVPQLYYVSSMSYPKGIFAVPIIAVTQIMHSPNPNPKPGLLELRDNRKVGVHAMHRTTS